MDEGSEGKFWNAIKSIFTGNREVQSIEELLQEAQKNNVFPRILLHAKKPFKTW